MPRPQFIPPAAVATAPTKRGSYLLPAAPPQRFISSGSYLLDCSLGGGWGCARVVNIVGDKSSGKTLLAIEACANFYLTTPVHNIRYVEAEAAFDVEYGRTMGFPVGVTPVDTVRTVEEWFADLDEFLEVQKGNPFPCLYVLDSLDALSDTAEMERKDDEKSYGMSKAKLLSTFFRKKTRDLQLANCTLFVVSQIRDKINVMFGETKTRSGGHALDFYASQIVWLVEINKVKRQVHGIDRIIGLQILLRNKKNKVGMPLRDVEETLLLNYGFDDETSMVNWLTKSKMITNGPIWKKAIEDARDKQDRGALAEINRQLRAMVWERWQAIEVALAPKLSKY